MIFISYAREDFDRAKKIYSLVANSGQEVFLDKVNINPGADWQIEIENALEKCSLVLLLCTRHSLAKEGFIQKEIRLALQRVEMMPDGKIFIIPLRFDGVSIPKKLTKYNWIDISEPSDYFRVQWLIQGVWGEKNRDRVIASVIQEVSATEEDAKLLDEDIVILLQGRNSGGDPIWSYLKQTLRTFGRLSDHVKEHKDFVPADWGEVLAAGLDEPSAELRHEMAVKYNLTDVPKPVAAQYEYDVGEYMLGFTEAFKSIVGGDPVMPTHAPPKMLPPEEKPWQAGMRAGIGAAKRIYAERAD
jgi:hypothetical protein